jgi:hypothetical protein
MLTEQDVRTQYEQGIISALEANMSLRKMGARGPKIRTEYDGAGRDMRTGKAHPLTHHDAEILNGLAKAGDLKRQAQQMVYAARQDARDYVRAKCLEMNVHPAIIELVFWA